MRNLSKTLTLMGLLTPVGANALGVGEIKLHSALNQVLEAEIPLITSGSESASDIRVSLASPTAFARAGIERPHYLSRLRFKPVVVNGKVVVKVSSREVIREPFLNFLIEVNWPQGRMLREFTVLLDPPATFDETSITATRAPTVQSSTVTKPRYAVDTPSNYGFRSAPKSTKAARPPAAAESTRPAPSTAARRDRYKEGDHVSSKRNDSLWILAKRVNHDPAISQEQMMVALYEANPHAFFKKNMNALMAGQRLKVPSRENILKHSRTQAIAEFARQNEEWNTKTASTTGKTTNSPHSADPVPVADPKHNGSEGSESKLKIVSPAEGETVSDSTSDLAKNASGDKSEEMAIEMVETVRQENEELRNRLKEAEQQLARMQLMLTLKDKQLSALQAEPTSGGISNEKVLDPEAVNEETRGLTENDQISSTNVTPATEVAPPESTSNAEVPFTVISESSESNSSDQPALTEVTDISEALQPELAENFPDSSIAPVQPESPEANSTPAPKEVAPVPAKSPEPADIAESTPPPDEADFLSELLSEPYYLAAGGGIVVLFGLIGWSLVRRRNRIMEAGAESILLPPENGKGTVEQKTEQKAVETAQTTETTGVVESSFLSEFTPSDFDALEMEQDDVDPVSEADVYLAYGRYQQAEDLIRNAIETYPDRDECKLKLLEIHFATEDRDAFEAYAKELEVYKEEKPQFWDKVAEMGREICPASALFRGGENNSQSLSGNDLEPTDFGNDASDHFGLNDMNLETHEKDFEGDDLGFDLADDLDEDDEREDFVSKSGSELNAKLESVTFGEEDVPSEDNAIEFDGIHDETAIDGYATQSELDEAGSLSSDETEHEAAPEQTDTVLLDESKHEAELADADTVLLEEPKYQMDLDDPDTELLDDSDGHVGFDEADTELLDAPDHPVNFAGIDSELVDRSEHGVDFDGTETELLDEVDDENAESLELSTVDLGEPVDAVNEATDQEASEFSDLTDMDEIETKLDLAKAYVDMDDQESARGILSEILAEGNDEQKTEARALVEGLENKA